jgi:Uma2 family endonuclease
MVSTRTLSVDDLANLVLPEHWELVNGEVVAMNPSSGRSARIGGRIYSLFLRQGEELGLGWAYPAEAGFLLFGDRQTVRSPDAAFIVRDRMATEEEGFVPMAPDLAVEVLSPSDRMADALAKVAMYIAAGVRSVWLVDPATQTVTIFSPDAPPNKLRGDDILDGGDVLPGFSVPVAELFS